MMPQFIPSMVLDTSPQLTAIAVTIISLCVFLGLSRWRSNSLPFPPGPRPDPIIGNVRDMLSESQEQEFQRWSKIYGDVNYVRIFGQPLVVLNSFTAAKDLLEQRGALYSGRPRLVLLAELMGWGDELVHQQPGPRFRKHRRVVQEQFSPKGLEKFKALQRKEAYMTLAGIGETPDDLLKHLKRFSAGIILDIAYGYTVHSHEDDFMRFADEATSATASVTPAAMAVDFFPILKHIPAWMPFAGFKRHALHTRVLVNRLMNAPYQWTKNEMAKGTARPCIATDLLEKLRNQTPTEAKNGGLDDDDIKDLTGVINAAATDTTGAVLSSFFLFMVMYGEVFRKAQAEIDHKIGNDRLLDFDDKDSLPYLQCVLKEVFRLACPVPLGVPHRSTQDDVYRDQFIPKNSTVIANSWAMMRDETLYPQPEAFIPERFEGALDGDAAQQVDAIFGFGRRACPGKGLAEENIWLLAVNFIAIFTIEKAVDSQGATIEVPGDFTSGFVRHPKDFSFKVNYRSEKAKAVIEEANLLHT